ncbi:DUF6193 family natural product biosynthesis protein [Kitasatospora sp. DSM 101779]|uniref:DUF6193 family natural product biosynthesis protein n=1 Tax=Kitasatospora sp. DSM 101779 TaxID=2853165 RepID=UPI0021D99961|nr:DUF6193 family natural product biosynthesis protein [Kitasatospora sp. DSM 101779]MCU7825300.1 hypothetical protein [Kitasatospora sp. DSM 101779]
MSEGSEAQPDPVAEAWNAIRALSPDLIDKALVEAAYADDVIRSLFPMVSHGSLQFSRCTRFPWSRDLPSVFPNGSAGFRVMRLHEPGNSTIGEVLSADEAVRMVRDNLPVGCGPAVDGTPDDLPPLS